jgi:hypothetical protein
MEVHTSDHVKGTEPQNVSRDEPERFFSRSAKALSLDGDHYVRLVINESNALFQAIEATLAAA